MYTIIFFTDTLKIIKKKLVEIDIQNFNNIWINNYLKKFANEHKIHYPTLMKLLRFILSGLKVNIKYYRFIDLKLFYITYFNTFRKVHQ